MNSFVDIHTHNKNKSDHFKFIIGINSLGIHPWKLTPSVNLEKVKQHFIILKNEENSNLLGIGECGLDRRKKNIIPIYDQEKIFNWHLDWALERELPIVVHCVGAYSDLLKILKNKKYSGKILLHDFRGNLKEAQQLLNYDAYFSFGVSLFGKSHAKNILPLLPRERIFLETDDQLEVRIEDIYKQAEEILRITRAESLILFESNLKRFLK